MKNVAASVRARLSNLARETEVPLAALMERFALGRLLWRLSRSASADRFVLKGAQLFALWAEAPHRPTRDVDLLGTGEASPESLREFFETLLDTPVEPEDGLLWGKVEAAPIREDQQYQGVRVVTHATLAGAVGCGCRSMWDSEMPSPQGQWKWSGGSCLIFPRRGFWRIRRRP